MNTINILNLVSFLGYLPGLVLKQQKKEVSTETMQAVYEEVKTPYKYGVVIEPPEGGMVDGPTVFHKDGKWKMVYGIFPVGDSSEKNITHRAVSENLLNWYV
jgi:hypothetical protein